VLLLEDMKLALARGAKIWAILEGAAATSDGEDMVVPNGKGAIAAMELALQDAGIDRRRIDYINLHGTSTPVGDVKEIEAIRSVFGDAVPPFSSTKSMTGHALGAAGALEAIFCILMMRDNFLAPNINLDNPEPAVADLPVVRETQKAEIAWAMSNSFGFGGTNCALVFSHPDRRP
jgi:3-oxoacyl-[acyl-carrier-protein] synthase-1